MEQRVAARHLFSLFDVLESVQTLSGAVHHDHRSGESTFPGRRQVDLKRQQMASLRRQPAERIPIFYTSIA